MSDEQNKSKPAETKPKSAEPDDSNLEMKAGLVLIVLLAGVFSFMAWQKWSQLRDAELAATNKPGETKDESDKQEESDPFAVSVAQQNEPKATDQETSRDPSDQLPTLQISTDESKPASSPKQALLEEKTDFDPFGEIASDSKQDNNSESVLTKSEEPQAEPNPFAEEFPALKTNQQSATKQQTVAKDDATFEDLPAEQPKQMKPEHAVDPFGDLSAKPAETPKETTKVASNDPFADFPEPKAEKPAETESTVTEFPVIETKQNDDKKTAYQEPLPLLEPVPQLKIDEPASKQVAEDPDPFGDFQSVPAGSSKTEVQITVQPDTSAKQDSSDPFGASPFPEPAQKTASSDASNNAPKVMMKADFPEVAEDPNRIDVYTVKTNDNYWNISRSAYGTSRYYRALAEYNKTRIGNPAEMKVGMQVMIPHRSVLEARYPEQFARTQSTTTIKKASAEEPGLLTNEQGIPMYRISKGDTLGSIAQRHLGRASRWIQIYELNRDKLSDPNKLKIGTTLKLPSDASRVRIIQ